MKKLLLVIFVLLIPSLANAQASKSDLIGLGMAPELANELVKGTVSNSSYIIQVDSDPQRKFTFDATSDTALTLKFGDGSVTDNQNFYITSAVADSSQDDGVLCISGGGTPNDTRGSFICSYGNDHSNDGLLSLIAGADAGSDLHLQAKDDIIMFLGSDDNRMINFDSSSDTALQMTYGDNSTTASQVFSIAGGGGSDDDDTRLNLLGGSSASTTEGGIVEISGNDFGGANAGGSVKIYSGDTTAGDIVLSIENASTDVIIQDTTSGALWTFANSGTLIGAGTATIGWSIVAATAATCTATCTTPCVIGQDTATKAFQSCGTSITGSCLCAGAS